MNLKQKINSIIALMKMIKANLEIITRKFFINEKIDCMTKSQKLYQI